MESSSAVEDVQKRIREKLNANKIRLWLPPYTTEDGQKGTSPEELASQYGEELGLSSDVVLQTLENLRLHALEKLSARKKFQETGIAQMKVKLAGNVGEQLNNFSRGQGMIIELTLQSSGLDLKHAVAAKANIDVLRLKLIAAGRVIEDDGTLLEQHLKHQSQVMAIVLSESEAETRRRQAEADKVAKTREAAMILSSKVDGGADDEQNYYLQIADQTGKPIDLPLEERKALALAMTLHEKGRAALKRKEFGEALLLLLEADKEFKKCRAQILDCVDNAAILCLDIVWCYLCLKNVNDLPDAELRLKACDDCFRKSYGPNLERLALVKGGTGMEKPLFMRLHLLQGILAYHQGRQSEARALLNRAENELRLLLVDDNAMAQVIGMGFTPQEARLALRACEGNVQLAVTHIMKKKKVPTATLR